MALTETFLEDEIHPIDIVEHLAEHHEWEFDRIEENQIAIRAANILGLNIAGVDLMRSDRGPLILEVNSSPGLQGIETCTNTDIASQIITFIERKS